MRALRQRMSMRLAAVLLALASLLAVAHVHAADLGTSASCATCAVSHHAVADVVGPPAVVSVACHAVVLATVVAPPLAATCRHAAGPRAPPVSHSTTV
jgi:hypothetical protein